MEPLTISIVNYYNTIPLVYGLQHFMPPSMVKVEMDEPSVCASKLLSGRADIGLVPVGALLGLETYYTVGNYCIGSEGEVATVELFSQVPLRELEAVYLDPSSRTSNLLARLLASRLWGISPRWLGPTHGYEQLITGTTGGVMIGNKVFAHLRSFAHKTDLASAWVSMTSLPFVFACFVSLKPVSPEVEQALDYAFRQGILQTDKAIASTGIRFDFDIKSYLTRNIKFELDIPKRDAIRFFLSEIKHLKDIQ